MTNQVHCLSLEEMKNKLGPTSEFGAVAAQCIYGKAYTNTTASAADINNASIEQKNKYAFALYAAENDSATANAIGLRWVDYSAKPGYYYVYKIYTSNNNSNIIIDTAFVVVSTMPRETVIKFPMLEATGEEFVIKLKWNQSGYENIFSGYFLERKKVGSKEWIRLNKRAMVRTINEENPGNEYFYSDSVVQNYVKYEYRLAAVNTFAEQLIATESIIAFGKDITPPSMATDVKFESAKPGTVKISWQKKNTEKDFKGFQIQKSKSTQGPWSNISTSVLSKNTLQFLDDNCNEEQLNYYRVLCLDTANNISVSYPALLNLPDSTAPTKPKMPAGSIDKKGVVKLHWTKGNEKDLMGYRIYRANQANHSFINITPSPVSDTLYYDTISISTLTRKVFYKIVAVDFHFNHSDYSEMLALTRPDIIKPVTPVFKNVLVTDSAVVLSWINSNSDDVKETYLIRAEDKKPRTVIATFNSNTINSYYDKTIEGKKLYRYYLLAKDESGLVSDTSFGVDAMVVAKQLKTEIKLLQSNYNKATNSIEVSWKMDLNEPGYYVIYKSENGGAMESYKSFEANKTSFTDVDISKNKTYQYGLVYFLKDGRQTLMSKSLPIKSQP
jgi:hypothetical protein